ncbi:unnamed protein product [Schistosoma turkestanicum]|nr:unnamed protein product [Schistosoma turkestanicum]
MNELKSLDITEDVDNINSNNRTSCQQYSNLSFSIENCHQTISHLDKTTEQQISENLIKLPIIANLSTKTFDCINSNVQNYVNSSKDSIKSLENVQLSHNNVDEIDYLYRKLRKNLKQNSLLEYYFLLILQHLFKSLLLLKNNFIYHKNEHVHPLYMYNTYYIIIIWKEIIEYCHLLICSSKIIHQNNFNHFKTLSIVQMKKCKSLSDLSNLIQYNHYPWNISHTYQSFSQCYRSSLPTLKIDQAIVRNLNRHNANKMCTSTSSSDFESICSDNENLNKQMEIEHPTNNLNQKICPFEEVKKQPKEHEIKSTIQLELSNLNSSNMNTFENLAKCSSFTTNKSTHSSLSNRNSSVLDSQLTLISTSTLPSISSPSPPPPPPLAMFSPSSNVSFTSVSNNAFNANRHSHHEETKNPIAFNHIISNANINESDIHKLKPFRWTKVYTSKYINVWNNTNGLCTNTSEHNETISRKSRNFINLSKLNILFSQKQKLSAKNPEIKISANSELFFQPNSIDEHTVERRSYHDSFHQKFSSDKHIHENNLMVPTNSDPKLRDADNSYSIRGRSLSSSRTMEFNQKHEPSLIDSQRCLNINIFLRQFRHIHINLLDLINQCDGSSIGSERLKDLIKLLPTDQEIKCLKTFQGNIHYLDPAERFFYDLVRIPKYYHKIDCMLLKEEFQPTINWIKSSLENVMKTSQEIITSPLICDLLQTVLEIGNYMNKGDSLGSASGFKISSLLKLSEVRSNDPKITLLHFLVQEFKMNNPQMLRIADTMTHLKEASDVSLDFIKKEINRFKSRLQNIIQHFDSEIFGEQSKICEFIEQSNKELSEVQKQMDKLQELEVECAQYFCECPTQFRITECLQTFHLFFEKMKSIEQEIKHYEQMDKERLEKLNRNDTLNSANTKYENKNYRLVEDKPNPNQDDHNIMMNLISNGISNPRIVRNRSRSRSNTNKLNYSNSTNLLSKYSIENNKLNTNKKYTDELNSVSKSTDMSHTTTSLFEHSSTNNINEKNNNIRIKSRQPIGQYRMNTKFQFNNNEFERERRPWSQIENQSTNSLTNNINQQSDELKLNHSSDEEEIYQLNERIRRLTLKFNKNTQ